MDEVGTSALFGRSEVSENSYTYMRGLATEGIKRKKDPARWLIAQEQNQRTDREDQP